MRQNQDIWNFHGSLTLNNGKLTETNWYAIVSNMAHFSFCLASEKNGLLELCVLPVLTQNQCFWNFHGPLTLSNGKLI